MKFLYPEIGTTSFYGQRWYNCAEGIAYPSITTVLGGTMAEEKKKSLESWRTSLGPIKADKISNDAATRGTHVHLMIEQHLKGLPIDSPGSKQEDILLFNSLKLNLRNVTEVWGQEVALYSEILGVAGRCDCIGVYSGKPAIIDFKTTGRIKTDKDIEDYWVQCAFYLLAHNEMFGTNIETMVILMGNVNGIPLVWVKQLNNEIVEKLCVRIEKFYSNVENMTANK